MIRAALLFAPLLLAAGCARDAETFPSLAPRPVEKLGFAEPEQPVVTATPEPALDAQIAALRTRLTETAAGFDRVTAAATRAAAPAAAKRIGSEGWLEAQSALAQVDDWRARTTTVAGEIDELAVARAATLVPSYPALVALGEAARTEAARQAAELERLQALTPSA